MKKLILVLAVLSLLACSRNSDVELEKKTMFTIPYGVLDDGYRGKVWRKKIFL